MSGISTEIFKQIETVENDHDASTAAALEAVERRGEMVVRVIEPRQMGRQASDAAKKFIAMQVRDACDVYVDTSSTKIPFPFRGT